MTEKSAGPVARLPLTLPDPGAWKEMGFQFWTDVSLAQKSLKLGFNFREGWRCTQPFPLADDERAERHQHVRPDCLLRLNQANQ